MAKKAKSASHEMQCEKSEDEKEGAREVGFLSNCRGVVVIWWVERGEFDILELVQDLGGKRKKKNRF
jgi:hypothetical protein